jgi:hypothetical protein
VPEIDYIRSEIERMWVQVSRQRKEFSSFNAPGYPRRRERLKAEQPFKPRALGGRSW